MLGRLLQPPSTSSFFLFGPRGTGKSTWVRAAFPDAVVVDLLDEAVFAALAGRSSRLMALANAAPGQVVVLDEVQKLPALLDEVHRLIETAGVRFVLTGSSPRKLKRDGANLLAGRAYTLEMHPFTAAELGPHFDITKSLRTGHLPGATFGEDAERFLKAYVGTYLREEVLQESLVRNVGAFARFLEAASFSQAAVLSATTVAAESGVSRQTVDRHFELLEDLLLASRVPAFMRRARRRIVQHPKFFLFDVGVYRAIRPRGPLDSDAEIDGAALETLVFQELRATNAALELGYKIHYWRTADGREVDFVLYGERGLLAFEVKRSAQYREEDLRSLRAFCNDYPEARGFLLYGGVVRYRVGNIEVVPVAEALVGLAGVLAGAG